MIDILLNLDGNILLWIQDYVRNDFLTPIFTTITKLGNAGIIWIAVSLLLLISKKTRKIGCMGIVALLLSLLINNVCLKNWVARTRPYDAIDSLIPLIKKPTDYSFPSGHTASSFAVACILYRKLPKRYGITAMVLAVLIAISRLYIGVHYPTDVILGMISGIIISYLAVKIVEWFNERNPRLFTY